MDPAITISGIRCDAGNAGIGELFTSAAASATPSVGYAIVASKFGQIALGATPRGVCWLGLSDSGELLERELRTDFRRAVEIRRDESIVPLAQRIVEFIVHPTAVLDLPLDVRATPFQLSVWRELCAIPGGATRSYGEIARRLGRPEASRAVGHANGSNPIAILIPCHRAIGADGSLTGYRWGVGYKRRLLEHERSISQQSLPLA